MTGWSFFDCTLRCFGKHGIECLCGRVKNRIYAYCSETVGLVEETIVETRATPKTRLDDDPVVRAEGPKPRGLRRAKYRDHRHAKSGGDMHGAAVIANKELATFEHCHKLTQRQR